MSASDSGEYAARGVAPCESARNLYSQFINRYTFARLRVSSGKLSELVVRMTEDAKPPAPSVRPGGKFPFEWKFGLPEWPPTGWALGLLDSLIVLLFSIAPLIFTVLILRIYPPTQGSSGLTVDDAFAEYFGNGELLFIALAIGGSVAAKIWLDAQYRRYSNPLFNGPIVIAAVFAALISSGRVSQRQPDADFVVTSSIILLIAALGTYAWLIANGPVAEPHSVDASLKKSSDDLAERVRKLRGEGQ